MIAFYARGTGQGHLIRSLAVARLLGDLDPIIFHDSRWHEPCIAEGVDQIVGDAARSWLSLHTPDLLVVDVAVEGVKGELLGLLDRLTVPKVYVYRHLKDKPTAEQLGRYQSILVAEPDEGIEGIDVCPVLLRDPESLERGEGSIVIRPTVDLVYPFIEQIAKSTGVVSPAGYNTYWEAKSLDVPGKWSVQNQRFDDQQWRIDTFDELSGGLTNKAQVAADHIRSLVLRSA